MASTMFGRGIPVGRVRAKPGVIYHDTEGGPSWQRVEDPVGTQRWRPIGLQGFPHVFEHFLPDAGATLPAPWGKQDTSAAGAPVTDYVADADGGNYTLALAADNEVETLTLYHVDQLLFDITKRPVFGCRLKIAPDITGGGGLFAAGDKFVFGLASARNATLDSIVTNAWFMATGANLNIYVESDDGTTDTDDTDTAVDYVADTFIEVWIDIEATAPTARFCINDSQVKKTSIAAATGNVQPYLEIQKAAAANKDHKVTVDWICTFSRS